MLNERGAGEQGVKVDILSRFMHMAHHQRHQDERKHPIFNTLQWPKGRGQWAVVTLMEV